MLEAAAEGGGGGKRSEKAWRRWQARGRKRLVARAQRARGPLVQVPHRTKGLFTLGRSSREVVGQTPLIFGREVKGGVH